MKKIVLSILCIASLAAATPVQAAQYHRMRPSSLISSIRNPFAGMYSSFSAWWNKDKLNAKFKIEAEQTIKRLQDQLAEKIAEKKYYNEHGQKVAVKTIVKIKKDNLKRIREFKLNEQTLTEKMQDSDALLELLKNKNSTLISENKEAEEKLKTEKENAKAKDEAIIKSVRNFAAKFNTEAIKFEKQTNQQFEQANQRLNQLNQCLFRISTSIAKKDKKTVLEEVKKLKAKIAKSKFDMKKIEELEEEKRKIEELKRALIETMGELVEVKSACVNFLLENPES